MGEFAENSYLEHVARKRAPAIEAAGAMVERGEYEQAIAAVREADASIYGDLAMAKLLETHLRVLAAARPATSAERLRIAFEQALRVAQNAYPDPHTQIEADDFARGRAEDRARLVKILGYDPTR